MKKRFTILIAALMLLTMISQPTRLWGQEKTDNKVYTLSITKNTSNTGYASNYNITVSSKQWSAPGNQGLGNYIKIGGNVKTATDRYLYSKTAISDNINKVIVTHGSKDSQITVNSMTLKVYSTAADAAADIDPIATVSTTYTDNGESTFTKPNNDDWSGCFYRINYNLSSTTTSNKGIIFTKAEFYTTTYTLTYSATNGSISGVLYGTSTAVYSGGSVNKGGKVTLTADPAGGYTFSSWEVSGTGATLSSTTTNPTTFTMGTANATVTANFSAASGYINVSPTTATPTCAAQDVEFSIDTDQTLDANPVVFYTTSTGDVTTSKPAWIGDLTSAYSSSTLTIPVTANTGAARTAYFRVEKGSVKSDVITINQAVYAPSAPTLPAAGAFDYTKEITITVPSGTTVYYTLDGTNPTSGSTEYSAPFTIDATKTVKAVAYDNGYPSSVVSATYTRTYDYISSISSTSTYYTVKGTVVATNTKGFVFGDATGYIYDYYATSIPSVGSDVSITNQKVSTYGKVYEFKAASSSDSGSAYTSDTPTIIDGDDMYTVMNGSTNYISNYQQFVGTLTKSGSDYFFEVAGSSHTSNAMISYPTTAQSEVLDDLDGEIVKVNGYFTGVATVSSTSYYSVMLESVEACPLVTTSVSAISNFTYNYGGGPDAKNFTVTGANLTNDITISTNSANFEISSNNSNWQTSDITISKGSGTVAATAIYVRLKSGLDSNTYNGTITVSSVGADDKEIALTGTVTHVIAYNTSLPTGCSVSSEPNGAQVAGESVSVSATAGSGYKFSAWDVYKTGESSTKVDVENDAFEMPAYNVTVSATFVEAYAVTYDANGGEGDMTDEDSPYISGSTVTVLTNTFTRDGYDFNHWDTKADDSGTDYNAGATFEIESAVTLYAQWSVKSYNVALSSIDNVDLSATWGTSGELAEGEDDDIDYGTEITLSASNMDAGKVFIWNVKKQSDNSDVTDDVLDGDVLTVPAYDITIGGQVAELFFKYSGELTEGDYIIAYTTGGGTTYVMKNTISSSRLGYETLTPSDNQIISTDASDYLWHIAPSAYYDGYWTIYNSDESKYAASNGTDKQAALLTSAQIANETKAAWSVDGSSTYDFINKYKADDSSNYKYLRSNTTSGYAVYQSSTNGANILYKKVSGSKHSVAIATGITNGSVSVSPSSAYEGQTVTLTPEPSGGYMLDSWDVYKTGDATTKVTVKNNSFVMPGYDVTVSATYRVQHTYTLVDGSTVTLEAGKHYIIASGVVSGKVKVMGAHSTDPTKNGYRTYDEVDVTSNQITETNGMYEVVFSGDDGTNKWTMYDENYGLFICSTNSGGNITASSSISNNTKWTVSISSGAATITAQGGSAPSFRYNSGSPRFTCYASGQQAVYLYKRDGDTDLEFHSNTSLASPTLSASNTMTVESGAVLTLTGSPSCTNASWLVVEDGGQLISSTSVNATVKKEIAASTARDGEGWYTIASSVSSPDITDNTNLTDGTYDLYRFKESEQTTPWENYKAHSSTDFTTLENGRGYLYRNGAKKALTFAGALNVGIVDYAVTNSGGTLAGVNLVGNPYSHNITLGDNTLLLDKDNTALDAESQLTACYTLTNAGGWEPGQLDEDDPIKPSQGFLIEVPEDAKKIRFSEGAKKDRANNEYIKFIVENSEYSDATYALFDKGLGLSKINHRNPAIPMIYIPQGKEDYAVAIMKDNTEAFGLNIKVATTGLYTLKYKTKGEFSYLHVIDRLTGEDIDMLLNGEYSFFCSTQDDVARFIVRLAYKPNYGNGDESVFAYQSGSEVFVSGEGELQVFDVLGRFVMSERINGVKTVSVPAQGVYVFRLVGENVKTQKIVIR